MIENISKIQVLWLIKNYLCSLEANKAVKYIEKYFPEINNLDKKNIKKLKKLPNLHEILKQFNEGEINEKKKALDNLQSNKSKKQIIIDSPTENNLINNVTQVNSNKKNKKRKSSEIVQEKNTTEEINSNVNDQLKNNENLSSTFNQDHSTCISSIQNRFKRIDENKFKDKLSDERLNDNSYWNMKKYSNNADDFASKAAFELGQVRGKGFRQEKAKKKRCSWKGNGTISTGVSSIQFSDSD